MDRLLKATDAIFSEWDKPESPGCALAVIQHGEIRYMRGYGSANLDYRIPITSKTVFDIGSVSKQFTAMCIAMLYRRGKLNLDDRIQAYLPEIPEYENPVTIRHMLHHTSGLRDYLELMYYAGMPFENDYQEAEVINLIASQKALNFEPGSQYLYSNSGYFLLSEIVERVSGQNMREFAEENIFKPLGMAHTHFHNDFKMIVENRSTGYTRRKDGSFEIDYGIFDVIGDGAIYTTVEDLYLWDQNAYHNILGGGGQELIELTRTPGKFNDGRPQDYALGLRIDTYRGHKTVGHGGSWYGFRAAMLQLPEIEFSVICLSNLAQMNPSSLIHKVIDLWLLEDLTEPAAVQTVKPAVTLLEEQLAQYTGFYYNPASQSLIKADVHDGRLAVTLFEEPILMNSVLEYSFASAEPPQVGITFEYQDKNKPMLMKIDIEDGALVDELEQLPACTLTPEQLSGYCGKYMSSELGIAYELKLVDGELVIYRKKIRFESLLPAAINLFKGGTCTITFVIAADGSRTGFMLSSNRMKNIFFENQN